MTDASNNGGRRRGNDDSRLARRTFASEASQHLPNKNAAASTTREEIRDDDDDDDEKKKKKKAEDDAFDDTDDEKDDAENEDSKPPFGYRGNKAGQISRNPGKRGGQGEFSGRKINQGISKLTSKTQLDSMNSCWMKSSSDFDEEETVFRRRKRSPTGEKGHWTERESADGRSSKVSSRMWPFIFLFRFRRRREWRQGEVGDRRLNSCRGRRLFVGES